MARRDVDWILRNSSEYIIGTRIGVLKSHSTKRMPEELRWDANSIEQIAGIPLIPPFPRAAVYTFPTSIGYHVSEAGEELVGNHFVNGAYDLAGKVES